ncbi:histone deacetylase superfamily protein [Candidatus Magnetoovum chiemensis]|nr:histone deacetylase superfamily protein [Candidatus Magnetoovum chiemensis]
MADISVTTEGFSWIMDTIMKLGDTYSKGRVISVLEGGYCIPRLPELAKEHVQILLNV